MTEQVINVGTFGNQRTFLNDTNLYHVKEIEIEKGVKP